MTVLIAHFQKRARMKLSMYLIERWLAAYHPVAIINSGEREIEGARLFSDTADISSSYLYVGSNEEFMGGRPHETLVMFRQDVLSIQSDDVANIFNDVLSAFQFYNDLEAQLLSCTSHENPEQHILSACEDLIGPSFIYTNDLEMIAVSQNYSDRFVNKFWDAIVLGKKGREKQSILDAHVLLSFTSGSHHMLEFREPAAAPYDYGIYNTYFSATGVPIGFMVNSSNAPITPYERDIASIIVDALEIAQRNLALPPRLAISNSPDDVMLIRLLNSTGIERATEYLQAMKALRDGMAYQLFVSNQTDTFLLPALHRELSNTLPDSVVAIWKHQVVALVWNRQGHAEGLGRAIAKVIAPWGRKARVGFGASNPFMRLSEAPLFLPQALAAARHSSGAGETAPFSEVAVDFLLTCADRQEQCAARHPAALAFNATDARDGGQLAATMRTYLLCERSIKQAADLLFIHRNTVLYRINQMRKLASFDLDDLNDRTYLLVSLLIGDAEKSDA